MWIVLKRNYFYKTTFITHNPQVNFFSQSVNLQMKLRGKNNLYVNNH